MRTVLYLSRELRARSKHCDLSYCRYVDVYVGDTVRMYYCISGT
jgi:hypothetical protein